MALESVQKISSAVLTQYVDRCVRLSPRPTLYLILSIGLALFVLIRSAHAAIVLNYMEISVDRGNAIIEWSTASEHELLGFELYYKKDDESQSQYQKIGEQVAQGNKISGAVYRIEMTEPLELNISYCFRLVEVTLNNDRGEIIDRCGYGIAITPTPSVTMMNNSAFATIQPTAIVTLSTTIDQPVIVQPVIDQPVIDQPVIDQPVIVTTTPVTTVTDASTPLNENLPVALTPTAESGSTPPILPSPAIGIDSALPTPTAPAEANTSAAQNVVIEGTTENLTAGDNTLETEGQVTSVLPTNTAAAVDASYIVLTVTPTSAALISNPTFTPFPTSVAIQANDRLFAILPNTQNLMIVLLCGVFSGASGLGILGLVTTLLYMRSRSE